MSLADSWRLLSRRWRGSSGCLQHSDCCLLHCLQTLSLWNSRRAPAASVVCHSDFFTLQKCRPIFWDSLFSQQGIRMAEGKNAIIDFAASLSQDETVSWFYDDITFIIFLIFWNTFGYLTLNWFRPTVKNLCSHDNDTTDHKSRWSLETTIKKWCIYDQPYWNGAVMDNYINKYNCSLR